MALGWMLSVLQRGRAALARLNALFAVQPAIVGLPDAEGHRRVPRRGQVAWRHLPLSRPARRTARARRRGPHHPRGTHGGGGRSHGRRQEHAGAAAAAAVRRRGRRRRCSTAATSARCRSAGCGETSAWCRRIHSCSRAPSARTSRFGRPDDERGRGPLGRAGGRPRARPRRHAARASRPSSGSAASRCRAGRSSA